jgi:hypothetical protein
VLVLVLVLVVTASPPSTLHRWALEVPEETPLKARNPSAAGWSNGDNK